MEDRERRMEMRRRLKQGGNGNVPENQMRGKRWALGWVNVRKTVEREGLGPLAPSWRRTRALRMKL